MHRYNSSINSTYIYYIGPNHNTIIWSCRLFSIFGISIIFFIKCFFPLFWSNVYVRSFVIDSVSSSKDPSVQSHSFSIQRPFCIRHEGDAKLQRDVKIQHLTVQCVPAYSVSWAALPERPEVYLQVQRCDDQLAAELGLGKWRAGPRLPARHRRASPVPVHHEGQTRPDLTFFLLCIQTREFHDDNDVKMLYGSLATTSALECFSWHSSSCFPSETDTYMYTNWEQSLGSQWV